MVRSSTRSSVDGGPPSMPQAAGACGSCTSSATSCRSEVTVTAPSCGCGWTGAGYLDARSPLGAEGQVKALTHDPDSAAMRALGHTHLVLDALPRAVVVADLERHDPGGERGRPEGLRARGQGAGRPLHQGVLLVRERGRRGQGHRSCPLPARHGPAPCPRLDRTARPTGCTRGSLRSRTKPVRSSGSSAPLTTRSQSSECSSSARPISASTSCSRSPRASWARGTGISRSGVTEWDSTMERIFGLEPGTFDGTFERWVSLIHPDDVDETVATLERAVTNKSAYEVEHRVIWGDGTRALASGPRHGDARLRRQRDRHDRVHLRHHTPKATRARSDAAGTRRPKTRCDRSACCASDSSSSRRSTGSQSPPGTIAS